MELQHPFDLRSGLIRLKAASHVPPASSVSIEEDGTRLAISATLEARSAPHWFKPLQGMRVEGAVRLFRTGLGFSGPSNFVPLPANGTLFSYESYMLTALEAADGSALVIYAVDHRRFLAKTEIFNRVHRHEFRNRRVTAAPVFLDAGFSTENIPLSNGTLELPTIYMAEAASVWSGLQDAARHIASHNGARVPRRTPRYFCSWYYKQTQFDARDLERVLAGARAHRAGFDAIQIDDGYCPHWGDWLLPNDRWPGGLQAAAQKIRASGHAAGIWVAPITAEKQSQIWCEHPDWILKDLQGNPIVKMKAGAHEASAHEDRYALDLSHPEVRDYIRHVFSTLREWGFTYFKTDFMDWGYADSTEVTRHTPGKTSAMWFDEALRIIRDAIDEDSYWLACISYFQPFVGYCDAMRVSSDVGTSWNAAGGNGNDGIGGGIMNVLQESFHDQFFNNILWANDPDCIFLRDYDTGLSDAETRSLALWSGILGGTVTTSDFFDDLPSSRLHLWHFLDFADNGERCARLPYWGDPTQDLYVAVRRLKGGAYAALFLNPTDAPETNSFPVHELIGCTEASVQTWAPGSMGSPRRIRDIQTQLEPHASALFHLKPLEPQICGR